MSQITEVGAWGMRGILDDIDGTIAKLTEAGCNRVDVMCNDFSKARAETPFKTHDPDKIVAFCQAARCAGIIPHLTSWIMPHASFIHGAAGALIPLCERAGAASLVWDAEEPWIQATGAQSHDAAADQMAIDFLDLGCPIGVSGIAWVNGPALSGLVSASNYRLPQCYATTNEGSADEERVVESAWREWTEAFGEAPASSYVFGCAGYDLTTNPADIMRPVIDDVLALGGHAVSYWTIGQVASEPGVSAFVAWLRSSVDLTGDGVWVPLDVAAMSTSRPLPRMDAVALVQGQLEGWSVSEGESAFDPGPVDGLPGSGTLAAVRAFQVSRGLSATGVVDVPTWQALATV